jgi:hypothetical protein
MKHPIFLFTLIATAVACTHESCTADGTQTNEAAVFQWDVMNHMPNVKQHKFHCSDSDTHHAPRMSVARRFYITPTHPIYENVSSKSRPRKFHQGTDFIKAPIE